MKRCLLLGFAVAVVLKVAIDNAPPSRQVRAVNDMPTAASMLPNIAQRGTAPKTNNSENNSSHEVVQKLMSTQDSSDVGTAQTASNSTEDGDASLLIELNSILAGFGAPLVTDLKQVPTTGFAQGSFWKARAASGSDIMKMVNEFVGSSGQSTLGSGSFDLSRMLSIVSGGPQKNTSGNSSSGGAGLDIAKLMHTFSQISKGPAGGTGPGGGGFDLAKLIGGFNKSPGASKDPESGAGIFSLGSLVGDLFGAKKPAAGGGTAGLAGILAGLLGNAGGRPKSSGEGGTINILG